VGRPIVRRKGVRGQPIKASDDGYGNGRRKHGCPKGRTTRGTQVQQNRLRAGSRSKSGATERAAKKEKIPPKP
jgi:hypothetical protein